MLDVFERKNMNFQRLMLKQNKSNFEKKTPIELINFNILNFQNKEPFIIT